MRRHKLLKNKIYAVVLIILGVLSVLINREAAVLILTTMLAGFLIFTRTNCIM